ICWNLVTWYLGLPSSSTHALIGGLCGAGIAAAHGLDGVRWSALAKQVASLVISPPIGFVVGAAFITGLLLVIHQFKFRPVRLNRTFRMLQVVTAAFVSYSHGANDAQKTMAAMTLALVAAAWIVTIPCAAIIAWVTFAILSTAGLHG